MPIFTENTKNLEQSGKSNVDLRQELECLQQRFDDREDALMKIYNKLEHLEDLMLKITEEQSSGKSHEIACSMSVHKDIHKDVKPQAKEENDYVVNVEEMKKPSRQEKVAEIEEFVQEYNSCSLSGSTLNLNPHEEIIKRFEYLPDNAAIAREIENVRRDSRRIVIFESQSNSAAYVARSLGNYQDWSNCYLLAPAIDTYICAQDMVDKIYGVFFDIEGAGARDGIAILVSPAIIAIQGNNYIYIDKGIIRLE